MTLTATERNTETHLSGRGMPVDVLPAPDSGAGVEQSLTAVVAAFSEVERLQWEIGRATYELEDAVRRAYAFGADLPALARAAELTVDEVRSLLNSREF